LDSSAPIRSRALDESDFQIPLWSVPLILVVLYVCLFSGLGALGLVGPDEPRYAAIARAMAETHDWVTPRLWGTPWFEKPVLYYWAAGIAMRIFGVSEFAARLPSALAALLAVLSVAWTALRTYGVRAAWFSLLMLPTSVAMIGFARAASPDMLFAGLLTASMAVAIEILQTPRPGPLLRVAFGFFLGAAVLAKGPAAVILAGGATLAWTALSRQWTAPFRFLHPLIIAVFSAVALPWYVLCALRNRDFLRIFIWQHNFQRYLTPIFEHRQPFWFFGPVFLLGILPWLPLLVTAFFDAARNRNFETRMDSPALFMTCWSLFTLLFFSLSQSKLPGYILPAIPPAVLLLASSLSRQMERNTKGIRLAMVCAGFVFPLLTGIALAGIKKMSLGAGPAPIRGVQVAFALAVIGWVVIAAYAFACKWNHAGCAVACTMLTLIFIANRMVLPGLDALLSARPAAERLLKNYPLASNEIAVYHLPRAFGYELNYYFGKELPEWASGNSTATVIIYKTDAKPQIDELDQFNGIRSQAGFNLVPATPDGKISVEFRPKVGK